MSCRSLNEQRIRQVNDPNEREREDLVDNLWYELRDESTLDPRPQIPQKATSSI